MGVDRLTDVQYRGPRDQTLTTPRDFFERLHAKYNFSMDGASEDHNALLPKHSTEANPLPWAGERVFCNPPWGNIGPFVELAAQAEFACLLVPSRTNTQWFHRALELGARPDFWLKRLKFGKHKDNSPADCLLLIFGRALTCS